ncbi:MAG: DinB family protein [Kiloniellales bacterium]
MLQPLIDNYQRLARYNRLANERLYAACAQLSDLERKRERPAFFGSIHATLNHIMVGDRIWLARFAGQEVPSTGLDAILYDDFEELQAARVAEDARIEAFAAGLTIQLLGGTIRYVNNAGKLYDDPVPVLVTHFFNHQTHHRGQVHDMLSQTEAAPPSLDLHRVLLP